MNARFGKQLDAARGQMPKLVTGLLVIGGLAALAYVLRPALVQILTGRKGAGGRPPGPATPKPKPKAGGK